MYPAAYTTLLIARDIPAPDVSDDIQSVLVSSSGSFLYSSSNNIGYWTDYDYEENGDMTR